MNLAVFISGRGSNLASIIQARKNNQIKSNIVFVFSNNSSALGLKIAANADIPTQSLSHNGMSRKDHEAQFQPNLDKYKVDLIILAGYMRLLSSHFIKNWYGKIINIHPSLLPAFPRLNTHQKAIQYGVRYSGCTVFYVDEGIDTGRIINQAVVPVARKDNEGSLAAKVLNEEHKILPQAVDWIESGKVSLNQGKILWKDT